MHKHPFYFYAFIYIENEIIHVVYQVYCDKKGSKLLCYTYVPMNRHK